MNDRKAWNDKKSIGDRTEKYIYDCFRNYFKVSITDCANDPKCYDLGDFYVNGKWVDSKSDAHISLHHNILIELRINRNGKWSDGWGIKGQYDYIAFYCDPEKKTYLIDFKVIKSMIENGETRKPIRTYNKNEDATIEYILIPLSYCVKKMALVATWEKTDKELVVNYKKYGKVC